MKNLNFLRFASRLTLLLAVVVSLGLSANAQVTVPDGFQYQAIARDASGVPMAQALISVRFTVDADNAAPVSELFENVTTNDFGLFNLVVGAGVDFDGLVNPTVKIEIELGNGYVDMGTVPFQSVPYAAVAGNVAYVEDGVLHVGDDVFNVGNFFTGTPGIVEPLEAVVVDANKSITGFGDIETDGTLSVGSNIEAQDYVRILSTANNTYGNWQSGALQVKGGAGIANDVWIGGDIVIGGSVTALSLAVTNGITAGGDITGGGDLHITDIYAAGNAYITGALEAASITTGSITASSVTADDFYGDFHGGTLDLGGAKSVTVGDILTATADDDAALVTAGAVYDADVILQGNIDVNTGLINDNLALIQTNIDNIANNSALIAANDSDIAANLAKIQANVNAIQENADAIAVNEGDIAANLAAIEINIDGIAANAANIAANDSDIADNLAAINLNTADIADNVIAIASNYDLILANQGAITSNADDIASTWTFIDEDLDLQHAYENGNEINIVDNNPVQIYADNLYGGLDVIASGDAEIAIDARLTGSTVAERTTIQAILDDAYVAQLAATNALGSAAVYGAIPANSIYGALGASVLDGSLLKHYAGYFNGAVNVDGTMFVSNALTAGPQSIVTFQNEDQNNLSGWNTGALRVKGGVGIAKDVYIGGQLFVATDISNDGNIYTTDIEAEDILAETVTTDEATVNNNLYVGNELTVDGVTALNSTLNVSDIATFASDVNAEADLYVVGNTEMTGTLDVGGDANFEAPVTMTSTLDVDSVVNLNNDLTVDGISTFVGNAEFNANANIANTFTLGNDQGEVNELMIGQGQGYTPIWTSVGALMADLTDGAGIEDFTYDGTDAMVVTASIDDATIIFTGNNSDITVDQGYAFDWTAEHRFQKKINAEGTIYSNDGNLTLDDAVDVTGAATLESTLDVDGLATFNDNIDLTSILSVYDNDDNLRVQINADPSVNPLDGEANFASFDENGMPLVVLNYRNGKGAIAVTGGYDAANNIGATTAYDANYGGYFHGVGNWTTKEGTRISYDPNAKGDDVRIGVSIANGVDVFTVDSDGDVMANDLTINDMTANDITAVNVYADMVDATTVDADYVIVNENVQIDNETITGIINSGEAMVPGDDANLPTAGAVESRFDILYFQELYDNAVNSTDLDNLHIDADSGPLQIYTTHEDGGLDVFATGSQIAIDARLDGSSIEPRTTIQAILDGAYMAQLAATDGQTTAGVLGRINNNNVYGALGATVNTAGVDKHYAGYFNGNVYVKSEFVVGESGYIYLNNTIGSGDANSGAMVVKGGVGIGENLNVAADINGGKNLSIAGNTVLGVDILHDMFTVNAVSTLNGATTINNTLDVTDPVWFGSTLDVDSATTLKSTLNVSDTATFESDVFMNAALDVDGATTLNNTLDVDGATTLNNTLDVDGATTLNNTLNVAGNAHFEAPVTMSSTLDVDGAVNLNDNLTVDGTSTFVGPANFTNEFQLDGAEGDVKNLMIGQGAGNTPVWTTVADLMEDLTNGSGIENFTYDGSNPAVVTAAIDDATLIFDTNSDIIVDEGYEFTWTAEHHFMDPIDAQGGIYNDNAALMLNDDVTVTGAAQFNTTVDVDGATTLNSTLNVSDLATFDNNIDLTSMLTVYDDSDKKRVQINADPSINPLDGEANFASFDENGLPLVVLNYRNGKGAIAVTGGLDAAANIGASTAYNTDYGYFHGVGDWTTKEGARIAYDPTGIIDVRIGVSDNSGNDVFTVKSNGDVMANDLTINDMTANDITAVNVYADMVDADLLIVNTQIDFDGLNITGIIDSTEPMVANDDDNLITAGAVENRFNGLFFQELYDNAVASTNLDNLHIVADDGPLQIYSEHEDGGLDVFVEGDAAAAIDARMDATTPTDAYVVRGMLDNGYQGALGVKQGAARAGVIGSDGASVWGALAYDAGAKATFAGYFNGNVYMADDLTVKNDVTIGTGTGGVVHVKNAVEASNTGNAALVVAGGVGIGKNLKVGMQIDAGTRLTVADGDYLFVTSAGTTVGTNAGELLTVNSQALFNENTTVDADFHVTGLSNLDGAVAMGSTLDVAGAATMSSTLLVEGATTLNNTLTVASDATFNGDATFNKDLDITNTFSLDGVEGGIDELMIGTGSDNTPEWTTVADLMKDLTDGAGIVNFEYDGSNPATVVVDTDSETIIFDVTGEDGKIQVNEGWAFDWTADHTFQTNIDVQGYIHNSSGTALILNDDVEVTGTFTATSATSNLGTTNVGNDLTVSGAADLNGQTTLRELKYFIAGTYSSDQTLAATDNMVVFTPSGAELDATLQSAGIENGQIVTILNAGTTSDVNVKFGAIEIDNIGPESATRYVYYGSSWYKVN